MHCSYFEVTDTRINLHIKLPLEIKSRILQHSLLYEKFEKIEDIVSIHIPKPTLKGLHQIMNAMPLSQL